MAGGRRTGFSGVFITALLAVMLLPGEYTVGIRHCIKSHNQAQYVKIYVTILNRYCDIIRNLLIIRGCHGALLQ